MMNWSDHMGTGGWVFAILCMAIVLALVAAGFVWLVSTRGNREGGGPGPGPTAREILDRRLANGELAIEQHRQLRDALGEGSPARDPQRPAGSTG